jgi:predicted phosphohydrolase
MLDKPYRVERREAEVSGYHRAVETTWAIVRTGAGVVCTTTDVSWAYLIVALLNDDEQLQAAGKPIGYGRDGSGGSPCR